MAHCISPFTKKNPQKKDGSIYTLEKEGNISFPCGKCMACKHRQQAEWAFRLHCESMSSKSSWFWTATYADPLLPLNQDKNYPELRPKDAIDFVKRVNQASKRAYIKQYGKRLGELWVKQNRFTYYLVGEYGERHGKPHYHAVFNNVHKSITQNPLSVWQYGISKVGSVTPQSIAYVTKYMTKDEENLKAQINRMAQFSRKSKKLGISYVKRNTKYHRENEDFTIKNSSGGTGILPRYFRNQIFSKAEQAHYAKDVKRQIDLDFWSEYNRLSNFKSIADPYEYIYQQNQRKVELMEKRNTQTFKQRKL